MLDLLQHHCLLGQLHYREWSRLNASFGAIPRAGNLAPIFFLYTADAHLNSSLLILNRLIDPRRDSLSIITFLRRARGLSAHFSYATPVIVREAVAKDQARLAGLETTVSRLRTHRNEQFVHLGESLLSPPSHVEPPTGEISYSDIYTLLVTIGKVLNGYSLFLRNSTLHMEVAGEEQDFRYLLGLLSAAADNSTDPDTE